MSLKYITCQTCKRKSRYIKCIKCKTLKKCVLCSSCVNCYQQCIKCKQIQKYTRCSKNHKKCSICSYCICLKIDIQKLCSKYTKQNFFKNIKYCSSCKKSSKHINCVKCLSQNKCSNCLKCSFCLKYCSKCKQDDFIYCSYCKKQSYCNICKITSCSCKTCSLCNQITLYIKCKFCKRKLKCTKCQKCSQCHKYCLKCTKISKFRKCSTCLLLLKCGLCSYSSCSCCKFCKKKCVFKKCLICKNKSLCSNCVKCNSCNNTCTECKLLINLYNCNICYSKTVCSNCRYHYCKCSNKKEIKDNDTNCDTIMSIMKTKICSNTYKIKNIKTKINELTTLFETCDENKYIQIQQQIDKLSMLLPIINKKLYIYNNKIIYYDTDKPYIFNLTNNVCIIFVTMVAGGGCGGRGIATDKYCISGGGGGGGGGLIKMPINVDANSQIILNVGKGGSLHDNIHGLDTSIIIVYKGLTRKYIISGGKSGTPINQNNIDQKIFIGGDGGIADISKCFSGSPGTDGGIILNSQCNISAGEGGNSSFSVGGEGGNSFFYVGGIGGISNVSGININPIGKDGSFGSGGGGSAPLFEGLNPDSGKGGDGFVIIEY